MEGLLEVLYAIPVAGLLFQLVAYLIDALPRLSPIIFGLAAPIGLGALCGLFNERSGIVNIGIEGMMLASAFTGFLVAAFVALAIPAEPSPIFGITLPLLIGVLGAVGTGMLLSLLHAWLTISVRADQIISGTIINLGALGLTGFLNRVIIAANPRAGAGTFRSYDPPDWLVDVPVIGWIFDMFLDQGPIAMSFIVWVILIQVLLFRSRWGLRTRAIGEHPRAADTLGIDVIRLRYRNVIIGGIFAGLAGAYLTLEATSSFQNNMTAGRGFIALAALIFGRWTPVGAFLAALLFSTAGVLGQAIRLRPPTGELEDLGGILTAIPDAVYGALPYILTIVVLAGVVGRSLPPAAVGRPYEKETQT